MAFTIMAVCCGHYDAQHAERCRVIGVRQPTQSRRERIRAETVQEIKQIALKQMASDGPAAISLRAIAREMGMTAGAIYSYYDTRDDLLTGLIADVYHSLARVLEVARDSVPPEDPSGRMMAYSLAYRRWAINNPAEFRLLYGDPAPGYQAPEGGPAQEAEHRACEVLTGLVIALQAHAVRVDAEQAGTELGDHQWSDFRPSFVGAIRQSFPEVAAETIGLALRTWGRMHGLVALEVYGHLKSQTREPAKLFHAEMADMIRCLGRAEGVLLTSKPYMQPPTA
jgi:AcrR family transcriptional regulator